MLVGISGDINSGKDLVGNMIQYLTSEYRDMYIFEDWLDRVKMHKSDTYSRFEVKKFADKLKDIVCILLSCTRAQLEDKEFKNKELGEEWRRWRLKLPNTQGGKVTSTRLFSSEAAAWEYNSTCIGYPASVCEVYSEILTPRLLMQLLGTDCGRNIIHPNIWLNATMGEYIPGKSNWILTDTRFTNEANGIYQRGGIVLRVERPETDVKDRSSLHESESALDLFQFTGVLKNTKDIPYLLAQVGDYIYK